MELSSPKLKKLLIFPSPKLKKLLIFRERTCKARKSKFLLFLFTFFGF